MEEGSSFVWKGEPGLEPRGDAVAFPAGFALKSLVQLSPPAAVTALAAQPKWGLLGIGTGYGFALFDLTQGKAVFTKCLINPEGKPVQSTRGRHGREGWILETWRRWSRRRVRGSR